MSGKIDPGLAALVTAKVKCAVCGHQDHSLYKHITDAHGMTPADYHAAHPGAELLSPFGARIYKDIAKRSPAAIEAQPIDVDSLVAFGVGFGASNSPKHIRGYRGFNAETHYVPAADTNYVFPVELTKNFLLGVATGAKMYIMGPTGSGKTSMAEQVAARLGRPFCRVQMHAEMEPVELTGTWYVNEHGTMEYMYSDFVTMLQLPSVICLDEYDSGNPTVTALANAVLEGKPLVLANKAGERVRPHPDCIIVATGNTNGLGDETGLYASTAVQSFATMNRFQMFLVVDYMGQDDEIMLLTKRYPRILHQHCHDMVKFANAVRDGFKGGTMQVVLSTRQLVNWGQWLMMTGNMKMSYNLAFGNQLGREDKKVCGELYQHIFGQMP